MTLKELYQVAPTAFVYVRGAKGVEEYKGGAGGDRIVKKVTPTEYPMFKQVLEVELEQATEQDPAQPFTVADLLKQEISIDVWDNVCEELGIAFDGPLTLTVQGFAKFAAALELPVEFHDGIAVVDVDGPEGIWQKKLKAAKGLFEAAAGYCTPKEWDEWFVQEG